MRAVCLKTHNFPTAPMALLTRKVVPDIDIFGSIALNLEVGGVNPSAVEAVIKYEARQILAATIDFDQSCRGHRLGRRSMGAASPSRAAFPTGRATSRACSARSRRHVGAGAPQDVPDGGGGRHHPQSRADLFDEMKAIVPAAKHQGVKRIVYDHPFF